MGKVLGHFFGHFWGCILRGSKNVFLYFPSVLGSPYLKVLYKFQSNKKNSPFLSIILVLLAQGLATVSFKFVREKKIITNFWAPNACLFLQQNTDDHFDQGNNP